MKILRFMTMWVLLMAAAPMTAQQPIVWADTVTIEPGGVSQVVLNIDLDTEEEVWSWILYMRLPDGISIPEVGDEYNGQYFGDEIPRVLLSPDMYERYEWVEEGDISIGRSRNTGESMVVWTGGDIFSRKPMKSTHGELVRIFIHSSLDEALTFTPEITNVNIYNQTMEAIVKDNELQDLPKYNTLYVDDTEALLASEFTLSVKMRNRVDVEGFGFDLILPSGMSFVTDADGNPIVSLSEERTTAARTNTFSVVRLTNQFNDVVRVIAASSNGSAISAGDGEVCTARVRIGTGMKEGEYSAVLRNISVADTEAVSHDMEQMGFKIIVLALAIGDANGDSNVTVADLTAIAHHILGNTPEGFSPKAADANQDGQVNVADYTAVAHLLLYGNIYGPAESRTDDVAQGRRTGTEYRAVTVSAPTEEVTDVSALDNAVYIAPVKAAAGEELTLSVRMKNAVDAEGFQFTLCLPEGVSVVRDADGFAVAELSTERTTRSRTNTFASSLHSDGTLHVMAASTNGSAIAAGDGEVCKVNVRVAENIDEGSYDIVLKDIAISDTSARSHGVASVTAALTVADAAGIADIVNLASDNVQPVYDLQGRRITETPCNGVYIRDGRKYVK